MSGLAKLVALIATVAHVWVTLIAAPWHQLEAHVLPLVNSSEGGLPSRSAHRCGCCHHYHCATSAASDRTGDSSADDPVAPSHSDDCSVCHVLMQPIAQFDQCPAVVICEYAEFTVPTSPPLALTGFLTEPVSRGPPPV